MKTRLKAVLQTAGDAQVCGINAFIFLQNGQRQKVIAGLTMTQVTPSLPLLQTESS